MAPIDLFCAPDDEHRVALLADLLERAGRPVTLQRTAVETPTSPCMVAWTRRARRQPWIEALFDQEVVVLAVRLDETPLPGPCARIIDMQAWPARSADRQVGMVVRWLEAQRSSALAEPPPASAARAADAQQTPKGALPLWRRWGRGRARRDTGRQTGGLVVLGLLAGVMAMLWLGPRDRVATPPVPVGVDAAQTAAAEAVAAGGLRGPDDVPLATQVLARPPQAIDAVVSGEAVDAGPPADAVTSGWAAPRRSPGRVTDRCRAPTLAAARAWARRRL